jgi:hypothetical protein
MVQFCRARPFFLLFALTSIALPVPAADPRCALQVDWLSNPTASPTPNLLATS